VADGIVGKGEGLMGLLSLKAVKKLIGTDEFKQWFRNSKLINEDGSPMTLYHITKGKFDAFKPGGHDPEISGKAIWLGDDREYLPANHNVRKNSRDLFDPENFQQDTHIIPVHARMERPLWIDEPEMREWAVSAFPGGKNFPYLMPDDAVKAVKDEGYDGIIWSKDAFGKPHPDTPPEWHPRSEYIVFEPEQIKSAISNTGEFSLTDPRLIRSLIAAGGAGGLLALSKRQQETA